MLNSAKTRSIQSEGLCVTTVCVAAFIQIDSDCMGGHGIETKTTPDGREKKLDRTANHKFGCLCMCVRKRGPESRGLSGDGGHVGGLQLTDFLNIKLSHLEKACFVSVQLLMLRFPHWNIRLIIVC